MPLKVATIEVVIGVPLLTILLLVLYVLYKRWKARRNHAPLLQSLLEHADQSEDLSQVTTKLPFLTNRLYHSNHNTHTHLP